MRHEIKKYLFDIREAAEDIGKFIQNTDYPEFERKKKQITSGCS
jgi:uncharacterized protein with HEPN domain